MNKVVFPDGKEYDATPLAEFIFEFAGNPKDCIESIDDGIEIISLSETEKEKDLALEFLFGLKKALKKMSV